ncbi:hypothetical protein QBC47DRAFT_392487 [Echria macrotheca]|uniref:SANT domain-containing protein n=1 Tax=Echria macrotheca TaxID=438768 RepID=A0AAJ0B5L0_9PEZI|nr:hypothetical protein QBC47DRAFT_392487 [Echria macrotheca]
MSRYGGRYEGDRRSRSRSPIYGDKYGDGDRRRQSPVSRSNPGGFPPGRDAFRDSLTGRDPPRAPKALLDSPSGPRGGGFGGDFRGRGRGPSGGVGPRGRMWRDDSRDRGREREPDYRDRPHYRDERSRERERERERERDRRDRDRDNFRGRRPSPQGRGRSPVGRDFRDPRDVPLGVDAERARRGSRDGPLSAGSSSSDPPFGGAFRGSGFPPRGRGGTRGRGGDWDSRGGRGRGVNIYDDRDRDRYGPLRSRSQEGRWVREKDDRERRDSRYGDSIRDPRDDRDPRDPRDRDAIRPKPDRVSHEPPASAKDVSPPPLAPSAPAFGSVPSRPTTTDIQSLTGKPPPTGPRALTEERPLSAGHAVGSDRPPPTGPSKSVLPDGTPSIPVGPRAQQQKQQQHQQRSSKQWINPALTGKKIPESPKVARSQSFASQQQRPFGSTRPDSSHSDHHPDYDRRPRSSDAQSDSQVASTDAQLRGLHIGVASDGGIKRERGTQSARASVDRDSRTSYDADVKMGGTDPPETFSREADTRPGSRQSHASTTKKPAAAQDQPETEEAKVSAGPKRRTIPAMPPVEIRVPDKHTVGPAADNASESDTDEDMEDYFEAQISKVQAELDKLEDPGDFAPILIVARYASALHAGALKVGTGSVTVADLFGPLPEGVPFVQEEQRTQPAEQKNTVEDANVEELPEPAREPSAIPTVETHDESPPWPAEPQPKVEETEVSGLLPLPTVEGSKGQDEDVTMQDAEVPGPLEVLPMEISTGPEEPLGPFRPPFEDARSAKSSPSAMEADSEDRTEDDESIYEGTEALRDLSPTPPTEDLPVFTGKPWYESKKVWKASTQSPEFRDFLLSRLKEQSELTESQQEEGREEYKRKYETYLRFTLSDDPVAVKSREAFALAAAASNVGGKTTTAAEAKPEGGRRAANRFATDLDMAYILEQSRREHLETQERKEREKREKEGKFRSEKEAVIPDMLWTEDEKLREAFYDTSGLLPVEKIIPTWHVVPWHVNFTDEEKEIFEKAYLEFPKQWGKIAKELPNRDFGSCIQYYYSQKRELNLKEKLRKQPKKKKKTGGRKQRSSALVSELGNAENENEEAAQEIGENGERRRPRRAAAPTWGYEAIQNTDSDGTTPVATPGRRRAATSTTAGTETKGDSGAEKTEGKKIRKTRQPRTEKEARVPKPAQTLAPTPGASAVKGNRSRSNSRAQGSEWTGPDDVPGRHLTQFNLPTGAMQPPTLPAQSQSIASPERGPPALSSGLSEVMAPPSLRPEPPPPLASVPTFDIGQPSGSKRMQSAQQASSYWSVSESTDFPNLLQSFGTDWNAIATHMGTKTAVMVKNYFVRQKEGGKPEWEAIAQEADTKRSRGEKRPAPPTPSTGPRKRYDVPAVHRPLAVADSDEMPVRSEPTPPSQLFPARFQVPIAQASPSSHPLPIAQATPIVTATTSPAPQQAISGPPPTSAISPPTHPLRPPAAPFSFQEKERDTISSPQPPPPQQIAQPAAGPVRIQQKPAPGPLPPSSSEPTSRPVGWPTEDRPLSVLVQKETRDPRDVRDRQVRPEISPRETLRPAERPPVRLKQEPDQVVHHPEPYQPFPPSQRPAQQRPEPLPLARQPEPPRSVAQAPQPFAQPAPQPMRSLLGESQPAQSLHPQMASAPERAHPGMPQRSLQTSMPEPYAASLVSAQPSPVKAAPPRPVERKTSSLMALLNDDPPPKRMPEVKSNPTPPPQPLSARPPQPPAVPPPPQRREVTPGYPYARNPGQPSQSAMPPLKPYQTQSPQPSHLNAPRSAIALDAGAAERDYYARHQFQAQHQSSASNSPQTHQGHHYPPAAQHGQQEAQQHREPPQMAYQGQQPYQGYPVPPAHASSPTPPYASHPSMAGRREQPPTTREAWPQAQPSGAPTLPPQHGHPHAGIPHAQHGQHQPQPSWPPPHQAQAKPQPPQPPQQSAWAAAQQAHTTGPPKPPHVNTSMAQQPHAWPTSAGPQQSHPLNLRDAPRGPPPYAGHDTQSPTSGMIQHQHHGSLGGGRYAAPSDTRRVEQVPAVPQGGQPYGRFSTPGPGQREPPRSYTPVNTFDPRVPPGPPGPPGGPYAGQDAREAQIREAQVQAQMREAQMREAQMGRDPRDMGRDPREMGRDPREMGRDPREMGRDPREAAQHQSILGRQLRPQHDYNQPGPYGRS